jgi:hypothetical protein
MMSQQRDVLSSFSNRMDRRSLLTSAVAVGAGVSGLGLLADASPVAAAGMSDTPADELGKAMRKLWQEHIVWTRLFIISFAAGLPDLNATTQRLLRNQTDIGNAIKPFYGAAAGAQLTSLLRQHILGAAALLKAAKAGDTAAVARANASWFANANEIATFLHNANPKNWPLGDMKQMMRRHLNLTLAEATAQLQGRYPDSVASYDRVETEILSMADMLTGGIVAQFPRLQNRGQGRG